MDEHDENANRTPVIIPQPLSDNRLNMDERDENADQTPATIPQPLPAPALDEDLEKTVADFIMRAAEIITVVTLACISFCDRFWHHIATGLSQSTSLIPSAETLRRYLLILCVALSVLLFIKEPDQTFHTFSRMGKLAARRATLERGELQRVLAITAIFSSAITSCFKALVYIETAGSRDDSQPASPQRLWRHFPLSLLPDGTLRDYFLALWVALSLALLNKHPDQIRHTLWRIPKLATGRATLERLELQRILAISGIVRFASLLCIEAFRYTKAVWLKYAPQGPTTERLRGLLVLPLPTSERSRQYLSMMALVIPLSLFIHRIELLPFASLSKSSTHPSQRATWPMYARSHSSNLSQHMSSLTIDASLLDWETWLSYAEEQAAWAQLHVPVQEGEPLPGNTVRDGLGQIRSGIRELRLGYHHWSLHQALAANSITWKVVGQAKEYRRTDKFPGFTEFMKMCSTRIWGPRDYIRPGKDELATLARSAFPNQESAQTDFIVMMSRDAGEGVVKGIANLEKQVNEVVHILDITTKDETAKLFAHLCLKSLKPAREQVSAMMRVNTDLKKYALVSAWLLAHRPDQTRLFLGIVGEQYTILLKLLDARKYVDPNLERAMEVQWTRRDHWLFPMISWLTRVDLSAL